MSGHTLATLNATFNGIAAVLLLLGYRAIKQRRIDEHRRWMLSAFVVSCLFLISYVTRNLLYGDTYFTGEGPIRVVYFGILISHVVLAVVTAPLVIATLTLGLKKRFDVHKKWARRTFPLWVYVSVTGVVVYLMLYQR